MPLAKGSLGAALEKIVGYVPEMAGKAMAAKEKAKGKEKAKEKPK